MHRRLLIATTLGLAAPFLPGVTSRWDAGPSRRAADATTRNVPVLRPEMFGPTTNPAETTASLRMAFDAAISTGRPIVLAGRYVVNGPISTNRSHPRAALDLQLDGDVVIDVVADAPFMEYFLIAVSRAADSHVISGGSLTIQCNGRVQRAVSLASNSGGGVAGGLVEIRAPVRIHNVHAPLGSNGVAYGLTISGPFAEVTIDGLEVAGVSRHGLLINRGDCKGIRVDQAIGPVVITRPRIRNVRSSVQDADGIFVSGRLVNNSPEGPIARIVDGVFEDCQGRSIKTQVSHTEVLNATFRRQQAVSIRESSEVDAQYGSLAVERWRAEYRRHGSISPLGRNHRPFFIQALYGGPPRRSRIASGELITEVSMPNLVYVDAGPSSPDHMVTVEDIRIVTSGPAAARVFRNGLLGYRAEQVAASNRRFEVDVRNIRGPSGLGVCDCDPALASSRPGVRVRMEAPRPL